MTNDYLITTAVLIWLFSIPAMLSAYADERPPFRSLVAFVIASAILGVAGYLDPTRYGIAELPNAVVRVIAHIIK
ncbi:MAG: hypothetical protein ACU0A6_02055 [Shimia sp.]|jgi:hypothetical protein|uniref:hypothetical protein n=1 Tax=Shimia sp. TaxID=1954381 RepID=UPI004059D554